MREMTLEEMAMVTGGSTATQYTMETNLGIETIVVTANPNNYLSSVLDCFNANWANNLTAGMIVGGVSGAWSFGVLGAASSLGLLGAPAAVAGGAIGAAAGALTSVPSTALVCAVLPRGAAIGGSNSRR